MQDQGGVASVWRPNGSCATVEEPEGKGEGGSRPRNTPANWPADAREMWAEAMRRRSSSPERGHLEAKEILVDIVRGTTLTDHARPSHTWRDARLGLPGDRAPGQVQNIPPPSSVHTPSPALAMQAAIFLILPPPRPSTRPRPDPALWERTATSRSRSARHPRPPPLAVGCQRYDFLPLPTPPALPTSSFLGCARLWQRHGVCAGMWRSGARRPRHAPGSVPVPRAGRCAAGATPSPPRPRPCWQRLWVLPWRRSPPPPPRRDGPVGRGGGRVFADGEDA